MYAVSEAERQRAIKANFRHEYASTAFVFLGARNLQQTHGQLTEAICTGVMEAMVVLGHHKTVDGELTRFEREGVKTLVLLHGLKGGIEEGQRVVEKIYDDFGCLPLRHWITRSVVS